MVETMTKALVTGAGGFVGSALCRRLIASGVEVHAVSRNPPAGAQHWWRSVAADMSDAARATMIQGCAQTPGIDGRTVELGSGEMLSIREVVQS
jgi:uncharacterized protein YbjT (DUF2867 family)